jgi:hypothetical protein
VTCFGPAAFCSIVLSSSSAMRYLESREALRADLPQGPSCRCSIPLSDNHRTRAKRKGLREVVAPRSPGIFSASLRGSAGASRVLVV